MASKIKGVHVILGAIFFKSKHLGAIFAHIFREFALIDLLLKCGKITKISNITCWTFPCVQLTTQNSTFALISGQPGWFASGDYDNKRTCY